ncbi:MAG TPA: hypothetical protein VN956_18325 [Pyrinomonadaceae bacterium]|nr:hypothetical protein [Pyrinomonadaceae bacterium]
MTKSTCELESIRAYRPARPDEIFICCASFEERSVGTCRIFDNYEYLHGYIFVDDQPATNKENHLSELVTTTNAISPCTVISFSETDPVNSVGAFARHLRKLNLDPEDSVITLDISAFNKRHLLMLLKELDEHGYWDSVRILYTEPHDYVTDLYLPMSTGIKQINPVPGFVSTQPLNKPVLLVIMLGYEGDRAMALFNNLDPNDTLLLVPKPAFHQEWEGRTESMNRELVTLLGDERIRYADSRDPYKVVTALSQVLSGDYGLEEWSCYISPLGTKPQIIGLYLFWRLHRTRFSILYAQPLRHNELFNSTGVGRTWLLVSPNQC